MNQNKTYEVKLNLVWYCQADSDTEAEQNAIDAFCLEDDPSCSTWDLQVSEMVNMEALKNKENSIVKLAVAEEMIDDTSNPRILHALKELIQSIDSDKEAVQMISKTLLKRIEEKLQEVE